MKELWGKLFVESSQIPLASSEQKLNKNDKGGSTQNT